MKLRRAAACAALVGGTGAALAAGGHHSVDDAAILEPGQCQVETWLSTERAGPQLAHAGSGCRVGPVELSVAAEGTRRPSSSLGSLQLKAAHPLGGGWSIGTSVAPAWTSAPGPERTTTVLLLATWSDDAWALHLNGGRDLVHRGPDRRRRGIAVEWSPTARWQWLAERYDESGAAALRTGARFSVTPRWQLDLSRAHRLGGGSALWTAGATWQFGG